MGKFVTVTIKFYYNEEIDLNIKFDSCYISRASRNMVF